MQWILELDQAALDANPLSRTMRALLRNRTAVGH